MRVILFDLIPGHQGFFFALSLASREVGKWKRVAKEGWYRVRVEVVRAGE